MRTPFSRIIPIITLAMTITTGMGVGRAMAQARDDGSTSILPIISGHVSLLKGDSAVVSWREEDGSTGSSVFAVGADGHLIQRVKELGRDWRWEDHGAPPGTIINSTPAAVVYGEGAGLRFHVFAAGLNGHLIERRSNDNAQGWKWIDHGLLPPALHRPGFKNPWVMVASAPSVVSWVDNNGQRRLNVFVSSSDGRLMELWTMDRSTWFWEDRGGEVTGTGIRLGDGAPLAIVGQKRATFPPGPATPVTITRIHVFMRGQTRNLIEGQGTAGDGAVEDWVLINHGRPEFGPNFDRFEMDIISDATGFAWFDGNNSHDVRFNVFVVGEFPKGSHFRSLIELSFDGTFDGPRKWDRRTPDTAELSSAHPTVVAWGNLGAEGPPFGVDFQLYARSVDGTLISYFREDVADRGGFPYFSEQDYPVPPDLAPGPDFEHFKRHFSLAGAPAAVASQRDSGQTDLNVFINRADGTLIENQGARIGIAGISSWDASHGPFDVKSRYSGEVTAPGSARCIESSEIFSIFPQWVPVEPPSSDGKDPGDHPQVLEGVVVASRSSTLDNPLNHTHDETPGARPVVIHDWNIFVAPDVKYQSLMSDGNFLGRGVIEVEWELAPDKLPLSNVPAVGDRVWIKGRWIYDCGHPPPKTEIHPPSALVVIRKEPFVPGEFGLVGRDVVPATRAVVTLSPNGGPVLFGEDPTCKLTVNEDLIVRIVKELIACALDHDVPFGELILGIHLKRDT